jgi:hypothetical protein
MRRSMAYQFFAGAHAQSIRCLQLRHFSKIFSVTSRSDADELLPEKSSASNLNRGASTTTRASKRGYQRFNVRQKLQIEYREIYLFRVQAAAIIDAQIRRVAVLIDECLSMHQVHSNKVAETLSRSPLIRER